MTQDRRIADYILQHRERLTREAITGRLEEAGYERALIDAEWERLARDEPLGGRRSHDLSTYVWVVYWIPAALIGLYSVFTLTAGSGAFLFFGLGWIGLYLAIAYLPARALARARPSSVLGAVVVGIVAPVIVLGVGGGLCAATIAVLLNSMGY